MSRLIKSPQKEQSGKVIGIRVLEQGDQGESTPFFQHTEVEKSEILDNAKAEAEEIIRNAVLQAEEIRKLANDEKEDWETEKVRLADEAKENGFVRGLMDGRNRGYEEYTELLNFAKGIIDSAKADYRQQIESAETVILELGMKVAEKIIGKAINEEKDSYMHYVKRALKSARDYKEVQLHIPPVHYEFLLTQKEELEAVFPRETDFYIYPNDDLPEGSCVIESANGRIDASVDSQLAEIKQKLSDLLEGEA
ncbi:flagellar assembly protein FliH [Mesobacillus zeae]|uniref:flagellar assembly protein FliH n=1 Tax=Mesobacillus zeae TaxID=1917180 RepID=UPI0015E6A34F|nr:flagellar assembly protein FliH [Mesobacillus zeae]